MREYIVESIINNLEHINLHFLKCVLAYTNVLAGNKRGGKSVMEENREKLHEMIDSMNSGMLEYFETFIRLFLQEWGN